MSAVCDHPLLSTLGNGAADIFSVFSSINNVKNGAQLALGELFGRLRASPAYDLFTSIQSTSRSLPRLPRRTTGAGIFVATVVVGAVAYKVPFTLTRRPFLRDVITYLIAAAWVNQPPHLPLHTLI